MTDYEESERYKKALETIWKISDKDDPLNGKKILKLVIAALHFPEVNIDKLSEGIVEIVSPTKQEPSD